MKFWMSGEIQSDVSDAFRTTLKQVEPTLNSALELRDYGTGLVSWDFIAIILSQEGPLDYGEVKRYKKRDKSCEFRLKLDHAQFRDGDAKTRVALLCAALLRSLDLLASMKVADLDVASLREDFLAVAKQQEWLV